MNDKDLIMKFDAIYRSLTEDVRKVIAYHGTNKKFKGFDKEYAPQGVFWFSDDKDKILKGESGAVSSKYILTVELTVNKTAGWEEYDKLFLSEIKQKGYDSIKLDDDWVIFDTKNIKILKIEEGI